nr:MAG: replication polyprotein [Chemarfal virus 194]
MPNGRIRGQYWILTIPQHEFLPYCPPGVGYIVGQLERGAETGFLHWQLMVYFSKRVELRGVKNTFGDACHAELTRSSAAKEYCTKDDETFVSGTRFELGELPVNRASSKDWDGIRKFAVDGNFDGIPSDVYIRCYAAIRRIRADNAKPEAVVRKVNCFWGDTGTGKSKRAWEEAGLGAYPKGPSTKFWDGYQGHDHVVIDEFTGQIAIEHLLRWFDRYPVLVEIKGSAMVLKAKEIWITSNVDPNLWYPDAPAEQVRALLRRLNIVHFIDTLRRMGL